MYRFAGASLRVAPEIRGKIATQTFLQQMLRPWKAYVQFLNFTFQCLFAMAGRVTFRHLEAFRAVMLRKTVTSAAEMMHVSQPVVTRLLNALEERLDFRLFERVKGRLTPTAQALLLFDEVQRSLRGVDHVLGVAQEIRDQHYGRLHIAAAPVMALSFLPKVIAEFSRTRPRVAVTLVMHSSRTVVDMVLGEQCDVGFGILPEVSRGQFGELLMSARLVCGLPLGHPLASRSRLSPKDLAGEHFVSHSTMLDVRLRIDSVFAAHGVQQHGGREGLAGAGVGAGDETAAAAHVRAHAATGRLRWRCAVNAGMTMPNSG